MKKCKETCMTELKKRHEKEVKEFQDKCKHPIISEWMEEQWAPAHSSGFQVRICNICWKVIERQSRKFI